jgi:hypothetical protein
LDIIEHASKVVYHTKVTKKDSDAKDQESVDAVIDKQLSYRFMSATLQAHHFAARRLAEMRVALSEVCSRRDGVS